MSTISAGVPAADTEASPAPPKRPSWLLSPAVMAVAAWAIATPLAFAVPRMLAFNGAGQRSWAGPIAAILAAAVVLFVIVRRTAPGWLAGLTAGLLAAWVVLMHGTITRGTPFPMFGLLGDSGRITAMATRYSVEVASSDAWIKGLPGEYPPLFPWLIGRTASLLDVPAWSIVGAAEGLATGGAIVAAFLMWQRLVPAWAALLTSLATFMTFANFAKSYELITLLVLIPWTLAVFGRPDRGRLHWIPAGIVGGLIFLTYYGWFVFALIGAVALLVATWRQEAAKRAFLLYLAKVAAVALVLSSWFIVPYFYARFTMGSEMLGDLYGSPELFTGFFPFLELSVIGAVQLIGLVGMLWLRNDVWWAKGLLYLTAGAYIYRVFYLLFFVATWHTGLGPYAARLSNAALAAAGALTLFHVVPRLFNAMAWKAPRDALALGLTVAVSWAGLTFTLAWIPGLEGRWANYTERAYREPLPDGRYNTDSIAEEERTEYFPVTPIQQAVESVYGPGTQRVSLSIDERLYAYLPWHGYLNNDRNGSFVQWDKRYAELQKLAATTDPTAFARRSANTAYGPIDIFVLREKTPDRWSWTAASGFNQSDVDLDFSRAQFDPAHWVIFDSLPENVVVAVRR
ncbi:arabinofuranosyltransferase [Catelliglobosispora koreensis]|uniref:arabinofuranosyltransferase n=1 Tax=Catelliglobosispora koreensis TaxID=129052 RepID=UPI0003603833|nr:arabinofuranosyltransferase [Catelliglobosispora koreensis]